ncbi:MAG TPA: PEGA domain-containing protein [Burkholderiales bacterium]|nr:PEGA domain-containing protein [Burkholderiales bacterium]
MSAIPDRSNRTFICSVAFLDIAEYSRRPVAEQIRLKDRFNAVLQEALRDVPVNDRIILDTGDGAAISFLGDPEDALFVTAGIRDATGRPSADDPAPLPVRLGINVGPVRLVKDVNGQPNIIGDGINVAQRVMGFAEPGQILVSRSYYEVVSRLSEGYAQLFRFEGSRTDKHVRAHDVYAVVQPTPDLARLRSRRNAPGPAAGAAPQQPRVGRWRLLGVLVVAILGAAVGIRFLKQQWPEPAAPAPEPALPAPQAAPVKKPPPAARPRTAETATSDTAAARAARPPKKPEQPPPPAAAGGAAQVVFAVQPWGEIYVDGRLEGVSPPLRTLEVPPGRHTIEVRNTTFPPYTEVIVVGADERVRIRHRFTQEANP